MLGDNTEPDERSIYLFCGKRCDRIKILLREPDDYVLLYKRLDVVQGKYRSEHEIAISEHERLPATGFSLTPRPGRCPHTNSLIRRMENSPELQKSRMPATAR